MCATAALGALWAGGCVAPPLRMTPAERLRAAYRSVVRDVDDVADFESADQVGRFRVESDAGPVTPPSRSGAQFRAETGAHSLVARLSSTDRLVFDMERPAAPARGAWRDRTVLILSVHAPSNGVVLALRVTQAPMPVTIPLDAAASQPATTQAASGEAASQAADAVPRPESSAHAPVPSTAPVGSGAAPPWTPESAPQSQALPAATSSAAGDARPGGPESWTGRFVLRAGWNLLRVDLDEVREVIALERLGSVALSVPDAMEPVELYLDDVLLGDDTREIVAAPDGEGVEVSARGRRLRIGGLGAELPRGTTDAAGAHEPSARERVSARRRFELTFADGVVVSFCGESQLNLCAATGLGPWPLALGDAWWECEPPPAYDDPHMFEAWGAAVGASQTLVEATPFRAVVQGRWRYRQDAGGEADDAQPGHTWEYTIYPDGRVYVRVVSRAPPSGWPAALSACAVALNGRRSFATPGAALGWDYSLLARGALGEADLLWAPHDPRWHSPQRALASADDARLVVVGGSAPGAAEIESAHMLRVWPRDLDEPGRAAWVVRDYREPALLRLSTGDGVVGVPGDADGDGFNESQGCYELRPSRGVVRFAFEPGGLLRYRPVFRIHDTTGKRVAAYLNGRVLASVGRDAEGRALVLAPVITDRAFAMEVVLREP